MFNFLGKIAFVIIAFYALSFTPFFKDYTDNIKTALFEKIDNVMAEVDRVSGEVDEAKQKIDDAKKAVDDATKKAKEVKDSIQKAADTVGDIKEKINEFSGDSNAETEPK